MVKKGAGNVGRKSSETIQTVHSIFNNGKRLDFETTFLYSVATLLFVAGLVKVASALWVSETVSAIDPFLDIPVGLVWLGAGLLEAGVAVVLLLTQNRVVRHLLILWLSIVFISYRLGVSFLDAAGSCPCLGIIGVKADIAPEVQNRILRLLIAYMTIGSFLFLVQHQVARTRNWGKAARGDYVIKILKIGCIVLLLPAFQVGCVIVIPPPTTGPIVLRSLVGAWEKKVLPKATRTWVKMENVSPSVLKAFVAAEDQAFFRHAGFAWKDILNSLWVAIKAHVPPRGASTITQQCARSLFLWQGRSWIRKALEAYYTVWMELLLSKRRILELYVNVIELGDGIYGIEAAAQHYYGKSARDLTREEAAMLAAILPAPKRWNPLQPNELVERRQQIILSLMDQIRLPWEPLEETARSRAPSDAWVQVQSESEPRHERVLATNTPSPASP